MGPRSDGERRKARGWRARDQARLAPLVLLLALPACEGRLADLDPRPGFANLFGAHLEGREPPPGLDRPWPRLSDVPARPVPPDPATRERISAGLADARQQSRAPQDPRSGAPSVPSGTAPPAPPRLAGAPVIRYEPAPDAQRLPASQAVPAPAPRPGPAASPAAPAASPAPLAPPPAPSRDLFAPPPAPSSDLLAPRRD